MIQTTEYFEDFINYYQKAKLMQNKCNIGGGEYLGTCGDDLMEYIHIYDTVERRHAGFQNMLQDLWYGSQAPKFFKWSDGIHNRWTPHEWIYIFLVHRLTGSGASFESDHGYRNTIIPQLAKFNTMSEMSTWIKHYDGTMFTSIGNQIPMFPKPRDEYETGGKLFFCRYAKRLVKDLWVYIRRVNLHGSWYDALKARPVRIRETKDFMVNWNSYNHLKKFHFQYTAVAADLADYFPQYVDKRSRMYYGKNCLEAMDLFISKGNKMKKDTARDLVMDLAADITGGYPKDLEDVFCDYIRYIENYIPVNREKTYKHLNKSRIWNNSAIKDHPKGRQKDGS